MQEILAFLNQVKKSPVQPQVALSYILKIQNSINKSILGSQEKDVEYNLKQIWDFFFILIQNNSSSIQNAIIRCANLFLIRNYSFFPTQFEKLLHLQIKTRQSISIEKAQSNNSTQSDIPTEQIIPIEYDNAFCKYDNLILAIFTFISPQISAMRIDAFLERCNNYGLLSLFSMKGNSSIYSSAPLFISRLKKLDFEWHNDLLTEFLSKPIDYQQIKIVNSIIDNFPSLFPRILETHNYSLISYILSIHSNPSNSSNLLHQRYINLNNFDESEITLRALEKTTSVSEIDNLLTILNFDTNVSLTIQDEDVIFTTKSFTQSIPLKKLIDRSALYNFSDIPIEILIPNENDNYFILSTKFQRMALKTDVKNCQQMFAIFNEFLFGKSNSTYDEKVSTCLQSLPLCINIFGTLPEFPLFLKKIIFVEPISWIHASDITSIISALSSVHYQILGGLSAIITKLFTFALSFNTQLSSNAINAILRISDSNNCDQILTVIYYSIDDFDVHNVTVSFTLLSKLIKQNKIYLTTLTMFLDRSIEIALLYQFNLDVLQVIFRFIGTIKNKPKEITYQSNSKDNFNSLTEIAVSFIYAIIVFFTGSQPMVLNPIFQSRIDLSKLMFQNYLDTNEIENINFSLLFDIFNFLRAFSCDEYRNLPLLLFDNLINVFPQKISKFAIKFQDADADLESSFYKAFVYFSDKKDIEVGSIWCGVYLRLNNNSALNQQLIDKVNPVFENMASFAFSHPLKISEICLCTFSLFIMKCSPNKQNLPNLILGIDNDEIRKSILNYLYNQSTQEYLVLFPDSNLTFSRNTNQNSDDYSEDEEDEDDSQIDRDSDSEDFLIQEDRTLSFYKVTHQDLLNYKCPTEINMKSFKNYLVLTQLKFNLVFFDMNQLRMLAVTYFNCCDYESLWALILYCLRHCRNFPFNDFYDDFLLTPFKCYVKFFCSQKATTNTIEPNQINSVVSLVSNEFINRENIPFDITKNPPIEAFDEFLYYYDLFVNGNEQPNSKFALLSKTKSIDNRQSSGIPSEFQYSSQNQPKTQFSSQSKFHIPFLYEDKEYNLESICASSRHSTFHQPIYSNTSYSQPLINSDYLSFSQKNLMWILRTIQVVLELMNFSDSRSLYLNLPKPSKKVLKRILFCIPFLNLDLLRNDVDLLELSLYSIRKSDKLSHLRFCFLIMANSIFRISKNSYKIPFNTSKKNPENDPNQLKKLPDGKNFVINATFVGLFSTICTETNDLLPLDEVILCIRSISEEIYQSKSPKLLQVIKAFTSNQTENCSPSSHNLIMSNLLFITKTDEIDLPKQWAMYSQPHYRKIPSFFRRATSYLTLVILRTAKIQNYQPLKNPIGQFFDWKKEIARSFKSNLNQLLTIFNDFDNELSIRAYIRLDEVKRKQHLQLIPSNQSQSTFTAVFDENSDQNDENADNLISQIGERSENSLKKWNANSNLTTTESTHNFFIDESFYNCLSAIVQKSTSVFAISAVSKRLDTFLVNQKMAEFQKVQKLLPLLIDHFSPTSPQFKKLADYIHSFIVKHKIATVSFHRNKFKRANICPSKSHLRHSSLNFSSIIKKSTQDTEHADNSNSDSHLIPDMNQQPEVDHKPTSESMLIESRKTAKLSLESSKTLGFQLRRSKSLTYFTFDIDPNFDLTNGTIEASGYNIVNTTALPSYINCLSKLITKNEAPNDIVSRVTDGLLEWLRECHDFNSVYFSLYLYKWILMVSTLSGPQQALNLACVAFPKYCNSFFPLFTAILAYLNEYKVECQEKEKTDPKEKVTINETFDMFKTLLISISATSTCKAHSYALQLLANEEHVKEALDLAQFDEDCDESNEIIAFIEQNKIEQ